MTIPRIKIRPQCLHLKRNLPRRVGAIDHGQDSFRTGTGTDGLNGESGGGGRGEVTEEDHFCPRRDALPKLVHPFVRGGDWERDGLAFVHRARFPAQEIPYIFTSPVFVVGGENFIALGQGQGAGDDVDAEGGIGDEDQIVGVGVDVRAHRLSGGGEVGVQFADDELDGLAFEGALPVLVVFKDRAGRGTERAVIEKDDFGIEEEEGAEGGCFKDGHGVPSYKLQILRLN